MVLCPPFFLLAQQDMSRKILETKLNAQQANQQQQVEAQVEEGALLKRSPKKEDTRPRLFLDEHRFTGSLLVEAMTRAIGAPCMSTIAVHQKAD